MEEKFSGSFVLFVFFRNFAPKHHVADMYGIDVKEDKLLAIGGGVLNTLLLDHTTGGNIIWATDDYVCRGIGFSFHDQITIQHITGENGNIIQPRVLKTQKDQVGRTKSMAEVFTPSWVCNSMTNLFDKTWFGRENVFNVEDVAGQTWIPTKERIQFPVGKTWQDYVSMNYLEITCGEAPFLASRYDTVTGEMIPIDRRIGILDRKMRILNENARSDEEWLLWTQIAFKATYGYEWQGDNLLLARESLLASFADYFEARFKTEPPIKDVAFIAYIISWNLWQMDGLKCVIPRSCHEEQIVRNGLFESKTETQRCPGCEQHLLNRHNGIYSIIRNWALTDRLYCEEGETGRFVDTKE